MDSSLESDSSDARTALTISPMRSASSVAWALGAAACVASAAVSAVSEHREIGVRERLADAGGHLVFGHGEVGVDAADDVVETRENLVVVIE